jgi:DNA-binding beta-propeller fold protein YncE
MRGGACHPGAILPSRLPILLCALAFAGCGSAPAGELPPAAALAGAPAADPARASASGRTFTVDRASDRVRVSGGGELRTGLEPASITSLAGGTQVAVLSVRERVLELFDARTLRRIGRADAGSGPVQVASNDENYLYVTDAIGGSVLVFSTRPELHLVRRYPLEGEPWAIAHDARRGRLWVTLSGADRLVEMTTGRRIRKLRESATVAQPTSVVLQFPLVMVAGRDGVRHLEPRTR